MQIKDSLYEQRNLLLNLAETENCSRNTLQKTENDSMLKSLQSEPVSQGLSDVVGLIDVKQVLKEALVYPIKFPQIFTGNYFYNKESLLAFILENIKTNTYNLINTNFNLINTKIFS